MAGSSATARFGQWAKSVDRRIVVNREGPVGGQAYVELDPVGAQTLGFGESLERVLDKALRAPSMGENYGGRRSFTL